VLIKGSGSSRYFACREEPIKRNLRSAMQTREICNLRAYLTHENLLTSVPTQNVDSAELTDIKRILNVLLKKVTCKKCALWPTKMYPKGQYYEYWKTKSSSKQFVNVKGNAKYDIFGRYLQFDENLHWNR